MKKFLTLFLMSSLLLAGCAKKAAIDEPVVDEPAPVVTPTVAVAEPVVDPVQTIIEEVQKAAVERIEKIFFEFDSYLLTPASKEALQANALWLNAEPEMRILIEGHTDERGASTYNMALGEKRAAAARSYLQSLGIAAERIKVVSYGEEKPAAAGSDEDAWALNRRAVFVIAN
jgi:peptidoglycan-associated lipoprotein